MSTDPDFGDITAWAFSLLTMRVNTPSGQWLDEDFQRVYAQGWDELVATFGIGTASEGALLDVVNMAMHLVDYLVAATGVPATRWLERLREDYVASADDDPA